MYICINIYICMYVHAEDHTGFSPTYICPVTHMNIYSHVTHTNARQAKVQRLCTGSCSHFTHMHGLYHSYERVPSHTHILGY